MAKKSIIDQFKAKFESLTPAKKRAVIMLLLFGSVTIIGGLGYNVSRGGDTTVRQSTVKKQALKDISVEPELLKRTMYSDNQNKLRELREEVEKLKQEKEMMVTTGTGAGDFAANQKSDDPFFIPSFDDLAASKDKEDGGKVSDGPVPAPSTGVPVPPAMSGGSIPPMPGQVPGVPGQPGQPGAVPQPMVVGEIMISKNPDAKQAEQKLNEKKQDDKKKAGQEVIYLPTSFMPATLLSGIHAPTSGDGANNPVPMLIRIKAPGVLPNSVKSNLKGCFVVAEGVGSLAKERVDVRLINLSCISKKDQAVIDQPLQGFVVDTDGKVGLAGRVVSKMGAAIARSAIAGLFGGVGEALSASSTTNSVNALGSTSTVNTDDLKSAAIGEGISSAVDEIQKFYLELAKNSVPVIEVGATKNITLVVTQGTELAIKNFDRIGE